MSKAYRQTMGVAYPIESINRKLALRSEKAGGKSVGKVELPSVKFMGGFTRTYRVCTGSGTVEIIKPQCLFVRVNKRSTQPDQDEIARRLLFKRASQGTSSCMKDLSQLTNIMSKAGEARADLTKTLNGVSALGYSTVRDWAFAVQYAGLKNNAQYDEDTFPANWD